MSPLLTIGIKAARRAGAVIMRYRDRLERLEVEKKGRDDFVSEVDRMAEAEIIEIIQTGYPQHRILAEESGETQPARPTADAEPDDLYQWIIDPLDGTTNFLHRHPVFAVSIGVARRGRLEHAVIYDPLRNEMFTASRGQGAHLDERRIHVSGQRQLDSSVIGLGYPRAQATPDSKWQACTQALIQHTHGIRHSGSAVLDLAYVACGRLDGFSHPNLKIWDLAAGVLLVREARGLVADFAGQQDYLENGNIVAANHKIFTSLLHLIHTIDADH